MSQRNGASIHDMGARRGGYSTAELLVVACIVVVLLGLILGAAMSARCRANSLRCAMNLQQLGVATKMYITDHGTIPLVCYNGLYSHPSYGGVPLPKPPRPPSPPPGYDITMSLGDYVSDRNLLYCPVAGRGSTGRLSIPYKFQGGTSGYPPSITKYPSRVWIMGDPYEPAETPRYWPSHGRKGNALFLDGHVKAYDWFCFFDLADCPNNPLPPDTGYNPNASW